MGAMNKLLSHEEIEALFSAMSRTGASLSVNGRSKAGAYRARRSLGERKVEMILRLKLPLSICFRNSRISLEEVLKLKVGSVIELNRSVRDPVTIFVNNKPIARGELITLGSNHRVRILELESTAKRIRSLG